MAREMAKSTSSLDFGMVLRVDMNYDWEMALRSGIPQGVVRSSGGDFPSNRKAEDGNRTQKSGNSEVSDRINDMLRS